VESQSMPDLPSTPTLADNQGPPAPASVPASATSSTKPTQPPASTSTPKSLTSASSDGPSGLLAELNKGGSVTSGLKKVDPSQMTHKNPELRSTATVPASDDKKPAPVVKPKPVFGGGAAKKPAKTELEGGNKWLVVCLGCRIC
jgi:adenylyl cyclase-associated protein